MKPSPWKRQAWLGLLAGFILAASGCGPSTGPYPTRMPTMTAQPVGEIFTTAAPTQEAVPMPTQPAPSPQPQPTNTSTAEPSPVPTVEQGIRFAVIGDYGQAGRGEEDVANMIDSWEVDFIITTGDNNYPDGEAATIDANIGQYYHEYIANYQGAYGEGSDTIRFFPTLGNHDWTTSQAQPYLDYFTLPGNERYYDFTWGPVHFFALDGDWREPDGFRRESPQADWLRERLAGSTSAWQLVYVHQPPFSSGTQGSVEWMRWPFKEWGADLVLAGHDHTYERLEVDGLTYVVNGLGGGPRYEFENILPQSQVRYRDDYGAMLVEASSEQIFFQFITRSGEVVDQYSLKR